MQKPFFEFMNDWGKTKAEMAAKEKEQNRASLDALKEALEKTERRRKALIPASMRENNSQEKETSPEEEALKSFCRDLINSLKKAD